MVNAIREELRAFARAVIDGGRPAVPLADGQAALRVAHRVLESMEKAAAAVAIR